MMKWCIALVQLDYAREEKLVVTLRRAVDIVSGRTSFSPYGAKVFDLDGNEMSIADLVDRAAQAERQKASLLN